MTPVDPTPTPPPTAGGGVLAYSAGRGDDGGRRRRRTLLAVGIVSLAVSVLSLCVSGTLTLAAAALASRASRDAARAAVASTVVPRALTPTEIAAVQARLRFIGSNRSFAPAQTDALLAMLATPGQAFVAPPTGPAGVPLSAQSIAAYPIGGVGAVRVVSSSSAGSATAVIDAAGTVTQTTVSSYAGAGWTTTTTTAGGTPVTRTVAFPRAAPRTRFAAAVVALAGSAVSVGLALLLFVAGVLLIAGRPAGVRLHRWYAVAKLPDAAVVTAGLLWQVVASTSAGGITARPEPLLVLLGTGVVACAYPIVLLGMLRRPAA